MSKVGLAALRVGWLEADAELVREIDKARQPFNVSATSQAAAAAVLLEAWAAVEDEIARVVRERARVAAEISGLSGFSVTPSAANFLWVRTERPAREIVDALSGAGRARAELSCERGEAGESDSGHDRGRGDNDRLLEAMKGCVA